MTFRADLGLASGPNALSRPTPSGLLRPGHSTPRPSTLLRPGQRAAPGARRRTAAAAAAAAAPGSSGTDKALKELTPSDFHDFINSATELVVVDAYTTWCGPCRMMRPALEDYNQELKGRAQIVGLLCNKESKELAQSLGVKVAPTFIAFKEGKQVGLMTGAKMDKLQAMIAEHLK